MFRNVIRNSGKIWKSCGNRVLQNLEIKDYCISDVIRLIKRARMSEVKLQLLFIINVI